MQLETVSCPECGLVAEVVRRAWLASTDGPMEHLGIRCVGRHWFLLPAELLAGAPATCQTRSGSWAASGTSLISQYANAGPSRRRRLT